MKRIFQRSASAIALLLVIGSVTGCGILHAASARMQSRDRFVGTSANPNVRYLPGSQALADRIAASLGGAVELVEQAHGSQFTQVPHVFVCKTECVTAFAPGSHNDPATQYGDSIFMNEDLILQREQQRGVPVEGFLVHELAHLLLYQQAGVIAYLRVPAWFKEGVAVVTSSGAGVSATSAEAAQSILAGRSFDPAEPGSIFRNRTAPTYRLPVSIFYRESALFVQYLKDQNPTSFKFALKAVLNGDDFQASFRRAYGQSIAWYWPGFVTSMNPIAAK